ncbi:MAG: flippase-like domain-containing protein [Synergistaceae bacterium]|jgi:uncharacterized membrane protein YbhN (UPF0104 family)|nr:flippase-like domain-containing protein [Synergistaceae bacterium]
MKRGIPFLKPAGVKSALWTGLKYGVSVLCLFYAFRGVPFGELRAALMRYSLPPACGLIAVSFVAYALMGVRLSRMSSPPLTFRSAFCATLAGLAINNVLPAKAGEVAKALWLGRGNGRPFQETLGIVFMERFFDVNVLALLSLWFLWLTGERGAVFVFLVCLAAGWGVLTLFKLRPPLADRFVRFFGLLGGEKLRRFAGQGLAGVLDNMAPGRLAWLSVTSLTIWLLYGVQMALGVNAAAGLGLSWDKVVSVFAVSGLSMLLPSSPGAIGVYEAFTAAVLRSFGVGAEEALAVTLFSHMAQFVPVTLAGGIVCAFFPAGSESPKNPPPGLEEK